MTEEQKKEAEAILGISREELMAKMLPIVQPVFDELERYKKAVEIARKYGEHYPVCNAPPPEIRKLSTSSPEWRAWREANRGKCDCWKNAMEEVLRG